MAWFMVDVETDGPIPGDYSMIQIGVVYMDPEGTFDKTFYGELRPISDNYQQSALDVCSLTREDTLQYNDPKEVMQQLKNWIFEHHTGNRPPLFISDNNGFDFMFVAWYFHHFIGDNPFRHTSQNLNSIYKGMVGSVFKNFKHLRKTEHTHHPVDDVKGNAEALWHMKQEMGLKISFK